jgi:hypothetical protein
MTQIVSGLGNQGPGGNSSPGDAQAGPTPTAYRGPRQYWTGRPLQLASYSGNIGPGGTVGFRVEIFESRMRVKISLLFIQPGGGTGSVAGKLTTLWLAEYEQASRETGNPRIIKCTDVEGTQSAPTAIPFNAGLQGYSREFVTAGDAAEGIITIGAQGGDSTACDLWLQTRIQPEAIRFPEKEWDEIKQGFVVMRLLNVLVT